MNYPACQVHPSRKLEILCLDQSCPRRLSLQCMACLNASPCMQHRWKIVECFVEEVFEVCETEEARYEKRLKPKDQLLESTREKVGKVRGRIDAMMEEARKRVMASLEDHEGNILRLSSKDPELHFKTVKDSVNTFRRSELRELGHLNSILKTIDPILLCDESGTISLKPVDLTPQASPEHVEEALLGLQETADRIGQGLEGLLEKTQSKDEWEKERQQLYTHIDALNQQIKQIPVLKQRIEDQALKLQMKNRKIAQYEQQLSKQTSSGSLQPPRPTSSSSTQFQDLLQKLQSQTQWRHTRTQKLLDLREVVSKSAFNHCQQCTNDTVKYAHVRPEQDPLNMDIGVSYCETAALINFCTIIIADELKALGYSEKISDGEISMAVITQKMASPLKKKHSFGTNSHYTRNYY